MYQQLEDLKKMLDQAQEKSMLRSLEDNFGKASDKKGI